MPIFYVCCEVCCLWQSSKKTVLGQANPPSANALLRHCFKVNGLYFKGLYGRSRMLHTLPKSCILGADTHADIPRSLPLPFLIHREPLRAWTGTASSIKVILIQTCFSPYRRRCLDNGGQFFIEMLAQVPCLLFCRSSVYSKVKGVRFPENVSRTDLLDL